MSNFESNAQDVIERLLSAYGVTTQRALAESLNVPSNNVSAWSQRNSVPGSAIIKCALDTGVDLQWLVNGKVANANLKRGMDLPSGEALLKEITSNGGKAVLRRILDAYGFTLQKQLCELLGISSATVSTWVRRNYFPGDVVVTCAIDTNTSIEWLATGRGKANILNHRSDSSNRIPRKLISSGLLHEFDCIEMDLKIFPYEIDEPVFITSNLNSWVIDSKENSISNGRWLLAIDEKHDIYDVILLPGKKLSITNNGVNFICNADDVSIVGKVIITLEKNF